MFKYLGISINVNFELYKVFYYVAKYKNVTKTSQYLNVSQPAITKHIKKLENILNIKLITKVPQGIELTTEGKLLYKRIKTHVEKLLEVELKNKVV